MSERREKRGRRGGERMRREGGEEERGERRRGERGGEGENERREETYIQPNLSAGGYLRPSW